MTQETFRPQPVENDLAEKARQDRARQARENDDESLESLADSHIDGGHKFHDLSKREADRQSILEIARQQEEEKDKTIQQMIADINNEYSTIQQRREQRSTTTEEDDTDTVLEDVGRQKKWEAEEEKEFSPLERDFFNSEVGSHENFIEDETEETREATDLMKMAEALDEAKVPGWGTGADLINEEARLVRWDTTIKEKYGKSAVVRWFKRIIALNVELDRETIKLKEARKAHEAKKKDIVQHLMNKDNESAGVIRAGNTFLRVPGMRKEAKRESEATTQAQERDSNREKQRNAKETVRNLKERLASSVGLPEDHKAILDENYTGEIDRKMENSESSEVNVEQKNAKENIEVLKSRLSASEGLPEDHRVFLNDKYKAKIEKQGETQESIKEENQRLKDRLLSSDIPQQHKDILRFGKGPELAKKMEKSAVDVEIMLEKAKAQLEEIKAKRRKREREKRLDHLKQYARNLRKPDQFDVADRAYHTRKAEQEIASKKESSIEISDKSQKMIDVLNKRWKLGPMTPSEELIYSAEMDAIESLKKGEDAVTVQSQLDNRLLLANEDDGRAHASVDTDKDLDSLIAKVRKGKKPKKVVTPAQYVKKEVKKPKSKPKTKTSKKAKTASKNTKRKIAPKKLVAKKIGRKRKMNRKA